MNTNELDILIKYHLSMAKIAESHVLHHRKQAEDYSSRRKELKLHIDTNIANVSTEEIIKALTSK